MDSKTKEEEYMIIQHFDRELLLPEDHPYKYLYIVKDIATYVDSEEKLVIYQALYPPYETFAEPRELFMSKVDKNRYPYIEQEYRFEPYLEEE